MATVSICYGEAVSQSSGLIRYLLEVLRSSCSLGAEVLVHENHTSGDHTEEQSKPQYDKITNTLREGRLSSKEGGNTIVLRERRHDVILMESDC